jgi:hypothetical protein
MAKKVLHQMQKKCFWAMQLNETSESESISVTAGEVTFHHVEFFLNDKSLK